MNRMLARLLCGLEGEPLRKAEIISWGAPVPVFGNLTKSYVATVGLNPSNREFVDQSGVELCDDARRFHTLRSLKLGRWSDATDSHLRQIAESCRDYFVGNPYERWFSALEDLMGDVGVSYYRNSACHLDLVPFATTRKWGKLKGSQRRILLQASEDALATMLNLSSIRLLILNGKGVVNGLQTVTGVPLHAAPIRAWALPRRSGSSVMGISYTGSIRRIGRNKLKNEVAVIGYNHNLQSSFGMTKDVKLAMRQWVAGAAEKALNETF